MEIKQFNSMEAAKILGVNVSTIKRWTEEGKLECLKTAGGHRKFLMAHLGDYLKKYHHDSAKVNLFPLADENDLQVSYQVVKGDFAVLIEHLVQRALESKLDRVQQLLNGLYLADYPLYEIYDRLITPALHRLGEMWVQGELSVIEEHFGSQTIREGIIRLQGIIKIPVEKTGRAVCLNLSGELHDIALRMAANILELKGYQVYFSGQHTSIINLEQGFERFKPQRLYISSTWIENVAQTREEMNRILEVCEQHGVAVFLGGQAVELLQIAHPRIKNYLRSFQEAYFTA